MFDNIDPNILYFDGSKQMNDFNLVVDLSMVRGIDRCYVTNCRVTIEQMKMFPIEIGDEDVSLREILNMLGLKCLDDDGAIFYNYNIIEK